MREAAVANLFKNQKQRKLRGGFFAIEASAHSLPGEHEFRASFVQIENCRVSPGSEAEFYRKSLRRHFLCSEFFEQFSYGRFAAYCEKCSGKNFIRPFTRAAAAASLQSPKMGPFTVGNADRVGPLPNFQRFLFVFQSFGLRRQTLARQLTASALGFHNHAD